MAKDAYYFNHDANTRSDPKIIRLRRELGREGSDVFFDLICLLREQAGHRLTVASIPDIAYDFRYPAAKLTRIVNDFDLFSISGDFFYSNRLNRDMEKWESKKQSYRERGSKGGIAKAQHNFSSAKAEAEQSQSTALAINKQINKQINKTDTNVSGAPPMADGRPAHAPSWEKVYEAFYKLGKPEEAQTFFNHYESIGWVMGNSKIINVQALANKWVSNPASLAKEKQAIKGHKVIVDFFGQEVEWTEEQYQQYCNDQREHGASGYTFLRYEV